MVTRMSSASRARVVSSSAGLVGARCSGPARPGPPRPAGPLVQCSRCVDGQCRPQRGPGPLQGAVHRGHRELEQVGHLRRRPVEDVPQDQGGPLPRRQQLQHGEEGQGDRLLRDHGCVRLLLGRRRLGQQPVGIGLEPGHVAHRAQRRDPPLAGPEVVEAAVGGDLVEPGPQVLGLLQVAAPPPGLQHHLLHHVLGLVERAEHPVAVHVQLAPVALGPLAELDIGLAEVGGSGPSSAPLVGRSAL